ncbi:hypothetical protein [Sphingomonas bacterium]|uniref:hypothetical protein n=1 Tax=Sphingomonas bacterium TaxID=1895847 RepID=UPI001576FF2F|nr:hypothetical protein [Sphingomonas bacterium]
MQIAMPSEGRAHAFHLSVGGNNERTVDLLTQPLASRAAPTSIWSRRFETIEDCEALTIAIAKGKLDPVFLGRLTMVFGSASLDELTDRLITEASLKRAEQLEEVARRARDYLNVNLYRREGKHGRHLLELQRMSSDTAEWSVSYDRAIERDRLCDWLRWQKERFLGFLNHAAEHGNEALARILLDEMFVTERRVKKEGRGAGGTRPLRMWRGD